MFPFFVTPHCLSATCLIYKSTLGQLAWDLSFAWIVPIQASLFNWVPQLKREEKQSMDYNQIFKQTEMTIYRKGSYCVLFLRRTIATSFFNYYREIENAIYQFSVIKLNISTTFVLKSKLNLYCSESKNVYCF